MIPVFERAKTSAPRRFLPIYGRRLLLIMLDGLALRGASI
jgi:hypothetical protein